MKTALLLALTAALGVNGLLWGACARADMRIDKGDRLAAQERYAEAIAEYDEAVNIAPHNYDAHFHRGNAYLNKGDYDAAIADYGNAIALDPNLTSAHYNRGIAYTRMGEYDKAILACDTVAMLDPDDPDPHILKADYPSAITSYSNAISLDRYNPDLYYIRGLAYAELGDVPKVRRDYEEALVLYEARERWSEAHEVKRALERLNEIASGLTTR